MSDTLLAFAADAFAPLGATWRALEPVLGQPRVIGDLPHDSGALELVSNVAQTAVVKATLTSTLAADNAQRFVFVLAKLVPTLTARQADTFLSAAMQQIQANAAPTVHLTHRFDSAAIALLWNRRVALLSLTVFYRG